MIKHAEKKDMDSIMALCQAVIQDMLVRGIDQWDALYPTREVFAEDIEAGTLYALRHEAKILGLIVLNQQQEPEYKTVNWRIKAEPVGIIHRLMVHPCTQGQGIASTLLDFAENLALQNGIAAMRLDVFKQNPAAVRLYEKRGYQRAGSVQFRKGEFFCMEKLLTNEINVLKG